MSHGSIGYQIWEVAISKHGARRPLNQNQMIELRHDIVEAINQLAADFRADLDATEKHYQCRSD